MDARSEIAVELRGVSKSFGDTQALGPIDLAIPDGSSLALIGPSGCGKSTLLQLTIGLLAPDRGEVWVHHQRLTADNVLDQRRRMGYVIQDGGLFPHLTARGNAALQARYFGWSDDRIATRVEELAELTRFPRRGLERYPTELSGGQRQRVGLIRALMLDPDVLLLDEPLGALDPITRSDLQGDLRRIFRSLRKTVVLVTHDLAEAQFLGERLVLLDRGTAVQDGSYEDLIRAPASPFVTRFVQAQRRLTDAPPGDGPVSEP